MKKMPSSRSWSCSRESVSLLATCALGLATGFSGCSPGNEAPATGLAADPSAITGELVTYTADFPDGHAETWYGLRQATGLELRLDFDAAPAAKAGQQIWVRGDQTADKRLHVTGLEPATSLQAERVGALSDDSPDLIAAPATDTYAIVLVDLGAGVNMTAAQAQARLTSAVAADRSFANYYNESSYGQYQITGSVLGPYPFTLTTCTNADTTAMATAIEKLIPATPVYNHLIYYFNQTNVCAFGGLGEEGSTTKPAKRTWMNGSLTCVVLMQEPGHNLGLMHANTMKCGTTSFSTTPVSSCTITEYGSTLSTMGGGCRSFNAYERWYMQWMSGCNGVRVPAGGTFNLLPLENACPGGIQVLQVPFPAPLTVNDPQATTTTVTLRNYYVELRTQAGNFDTYGATGRGGGVTFAAPTVFIYVSDDVHVPPATPPRGGGGQNSVWTELLTTTPGGTTMTGLTAAGQSFVDPAGGATITLQSISATGATIVVTNPLGTGSPTCIGGAALVGSGPAACGAVTGAGGATGADGGVVVGTGGAPGAGGATGGGTGGAKGTTGAGGATGTAGATGTTPGSGGTTGAGGAKAPSGGAGAPGSPATGPDAGIKETGTGMVTGGCGCSVPTGGAPVWSGVAGAIALGLLRRRRRPGR